MDDEAAHGEVPGTAAYKLRTQDAVPDEIEVVPEGQRSRSSSRLKEEDRPFSPGGSPVPKTVVDKVESDHPSHGEVPGTAAYDLRKADAQPDEVHEIHGAEAKPLSRKYPPLTPAGPRFDEGKVNQPQNTDLDPEAKATAGHRQADR